MIILGHRYYLTKDTLFSNHLSTHCYSYLNLANYVTVFLLNKVTIVTPGAKQVNLHCGTNFRVAT